MNSPTWKDTPLALFVGPKYYPSPGFRNHIGQFDDLEQASAVGRKLAEDEGLGWWQIVDLMTLQVVAGDGAGYSGLFGLVSAGK